ncbi:hypothetical protein J0S82_011171 [Galemys pyrenaicus]|uniref:Uncharacterized protein n=1 Tax=Galemys pyrenaicus TaxID=202257 RepID=A0A8J6A3J6_GALPY|nr:hypothetical protein J0S82_011171 [Galemys pyrenaicus]
MSSNSLQQEHT